jgi:hypothetical protein
VADEFVPFEEYFWVGSDPHFVLPIRLIHFTDSIEVFHAKMSLRPRHGRTPGYYAVWQAYIGYPRLEYVSYGVGPLGLKSIQLAARYPAYVRLMPRQTGKRTTMMALQMANSGIGRADWPRSPQMRFFLHAAHPSMDRREMDEVFYPDGGIEQLCELAYDDLFPFIRKIDKSDLDRTGHAGRRSLRSRR